MAKRRLQDYSVEEIARFSEMENVISELNRKAALTGEVEVELPYSEEQIAELSRYQELVLIERAYEGVLDEYPALNLGHETNLIMGMNSNNAIVKESLTKYTQEQVKQFIEMERVIHGLNQKAALTGEVEVDLPYSEEQIAELSRYQELALEERAKESLGLK